MLWRGGTRSKVSATRPLLLLCTSTTTETEAALRTRRRNWLSGASPVDVVVRLGVGRFSGSHGASGSPGILVISEGPTETTLLRWLSDGHAHRPRCQTLPGFCKCTFEVVEGGELSIAKAFRTVGNIPHYPHTSQGELGEEGGDFLVDDAVVEVAEEGGVWRGRREGNGWTGSVVAESTLTGAV